MLIIKSTLPVSSWQGQSKIQILKSHQITKWQTRRYQSKKIKKILKPLKCSTLFQSSEWLHLWMTEKLVLWYSSLQCLQDYAKVPAITAGGGNRWQQQLSSRVGRTANESLHWFCTHSHRVTASIPKALYWSLPLTGRILDTGLFQMLTITQVDHVWCKINNIMWFPNVDLPFLEQNRSISCLLSKQYAIQNSVPHHPIRQSYLSLLAAQL